jgi:aminocarboxymuconate-semialdehyde decarboxylase
MYGTDYPCGDPAAALALLGELNLSPAEPQKLFRAAHSQFARFRSGYL